MEKQKIVRYSLTILGEIEIPADEEWNEEYIRDKIAEDYYDNGLSIRNVNDIEYEVI